MPTRKKALPRSKGRGGEILTRKLRSTDIANWLDHAGKEYRFMNKSYRRLVFYSAIIIDAFGIPAAIFGWLNSWILFCLTFFISLLGVVLGAVNTGNLLPIPLAMLYAGIWIAIMYHYFPWNPFYVFGIGAVIAFIHVLLFSKNHR